ncbi:hypothetical protein TNCV_1462311 [Trichonephila clavipes]|nr:hypothetical protein TNCV_1462311 [Trichonephila clavipes]
MARKKNLANQERKRREFQDQSENLERSSSAATESYHSTSPMLELILTNKTTDEPKDLILPSSNHTSRPGTEQDSTCKGRLALSEELCQLTLAVQATNAAINNYKVHSFLIAHQLQLQAVY